MINKTRRTFAYILNFLIIGSGFLLYKKILIGFIWFTFSLLPILVVNIVGLNICRVLFLVAMILSYIHLYKIINNYEEPVILVKKKKDDFIQSETPEKIKWVVWVWNLLRWKLPVSISIILMIIMAVLFIKYGTAPFRDTGSFRHSGDVYYSYTSTTPDIINDNTLSQTITLIYENHVHQLIDFYGVYNKKESVEIPTVTSSPVVIINEVNNQNIPVIINGEFGTTIKNISSRERYLQDLGYVIWDDKRISKPIGYGERLSIFNINGNKIATTTSSILFGPNESKYLKGSFKLIIWDIDTYNKYIKPNWFEGGLRISLLMEDSRGNVFDVNGDIISLKLVDSWWQLLFDKPSLWRFKDYCFITKNIIEWRIVSFLNWLK